jgi:ubiquinone/menaquinone biosynthesis C-methylase UbiE
MDTETAVAKHYTHGSLEEALFRAIRSAGKDPEHLTADELSGVDEFHLGWRPATEALARDMALRPGERLLDIGSGLGGPARYFAATHGCQVTGIDLTPEFVAVAVSLTRRCGLADKAAFQQGSALALPFADASFEAATLIHVGMNIGDKARLFAEAKRVLKPGGRFGIYDVMRAKDGPLPFPLPWSQGPQTSFVETPETYRRLLAEAGFAVEGTVDRSAFVRELMRAQQAKAAAEGPPVLSLQVLMGATRKERMANVFAALESGLIAPTQILARG